MSGDSLVERISRTLSAQSDKSGDWQEFEARAREIIAVMRRPSSIIARAGANIPVGCCMTNASDAGEVWDYMVAAALAEPV